MTEPIGACARASPSPGTTVVAVHPGRWARPRSRATTTRRWPCPGCSREIAQGEASGVDGYVIACFGDPGLDAARELADGPVVGIAEAAMRTATTSGRGFSVVTTLGRTAGGPGTSPSATGWPGLPERARVRDPRAGAGGPGATLDADHGGVRARRRRGRRPTRSCWAAPAWPTCRAHDRGRDRRPRGRRRRGGDAHRGGAGRARPAHRRPRRVRTAAAEALHRPAAEFQIE